MSPVISTSPASSPSPEKSPNVPIEAHDPGVTWRVVVLCMTLALALGYGISVIDYRFYNTYLGATHLPPGAIGVLLAMLLVVNPLLRLLSKQWAFTRNEVLTVYLSCLFSCLVPGIGGNNYFVSFIIGAFYFSTRENKWFDFLKGLPPWFTPALNADGSMNKYVVDSWYMGLSPGQQIPWGAWVVPLLAWGAFFFASFLMMGCLSVMLRAQWSENEALSYPLLRLPLEMTEDLEKKRPLNERFFRNPLMWSGFFIAVVFQLLNGLNLYFPDVPAVSIDFNMAPMLSEAPWNQLGGVTVRINPIVIGIAFLMTSELSFSFWFFYWFFKFQLILAYLTGFPPATVPQMINPVMPQFTGYQEVGANFAYAALIFWMARRHLAHIARRAFGRARSTQGEAREALSYPLAFWGFCVSFAFMVVWGIAAGMSWHLSLLLWIMYLVIAVVLSRVVAEAGLLFVHHTWAPLGSLAQLLGIGPGTALSPAHGLGVAGFIESATMQDFRASLMPSFVQSFKLAHSRGIAARPLFALLIGVILVGMAMAFTMNVRLGYENGGLTLGSWLSKGGPTALGRNVASLSGTSQPISAAAWLWLSVGIATTGLLMLARSRLAWFPLHPLGYLMGLTLPLQLLWFSIFVGWGFKTVITRYGGHEGYRKSAPLFLGLVLGDVAMFLFWIAVDGWQGRTSHRIMRVNSHLPSITFGRSSQASRALLAPAPPPLIRTR